MSASYGKPLSIILATVDVSEMMGSSIHLHVNANGKDMVVIVPTLGLSGTNETRLTYGTKVGFTFSGSVIHMFDKGSGVNLIG